MFSTRDKIELNNLPKHIAIIMDGNGRWAKTHGKPRVFGHKMELFTSREVQELSENLELDYLIYKRLSMETGQKHNLK